MPRALTSRRSRGGARRRSRSPVRGPHAATSASAARLEGRATRRGCPRRSLRTAPSGTPYRGTRGLSASRPGAPESPCREASIERSGGAPRASLTGVLRLGDRRVISGRASSVRNLQYQGPRVRLTLVSASIDDRAARRSRAGSDGQGRSARGGFWTCGNASPCGSDDRLNRYSGISWPRGPLGDAAEQAEATTPSAHPQFRFRERSFGVYPARLTFRINVS